MRYFVSFIVLSSFLISISIGKNENEDERRNLGKRPVTPKTSGSPWPLPQILHFGPSVMDIRPSNFSLATTYKCDVLQKAFTRYSRLIFPQSVARDFWRKIRRNRNNQRPEFSALNVVVHQPCERYPYFGMNENCKCSRTKSDVTCRQKYIIEQECDTFC